MEMIPEKLSENGYVLINRENIAKEVEKITDSTGRRRALRSLGRSRGDQSDGSPPPAGAAAFGRRDFGRRAVDCADSEEGRAVPIPARRSVGVIAGDER